MSDIISKAQKLRVTIEGLSSHLDDSDAMENVELFPSWQNESVCKTGDRVRHNGILYKVTQEHTSQSDWTPDTAVSLFAKVLPGQDGTEIGEWVQPDSTNGYMTGDRVTYNGKTYESLIDNNVWDPESYPAGWKEV